MKYSKAIFGSSTREDFDKFSDKDLLIVAETYEELNILKKCYDSGDWSVSYYTYSKLKMISSKGGLFIQHLRGESNILLDDEGKLLEILLTFVPKESYKPDVSDALSFFKHLQIFEFDHSRKLNGWLCDTVYVAFRNLLIYQQAEKCDYEFSFIKLLEKNYLESEIISFLRELRVIKRNYRENIEDELPDRDFIIKLFETLKQIEIIDDYCVVSPNQYLYILEKQLKSAINPYLKLRLFEAYYIVSGYKNEELEKIFKNPQMYTFNFNDNRYVMSLIRKLKSKHQLNALESDGILRNNLNHH